MFILVKPTNQKKGVVIFNHKEILRNKRFSELKILKDKWIFGLNNGGWLGKYENFIKQKYDDIIDFYLSAYPIVNKQKNIPFCGSSFISKIFCLLENNKNLKNIRDKDLYNFVADNPKNIERNIDLICLSRNIPGKNVDKLINFLYSIKDNLSIKVLIYCYSPKKLNKNKKKNKNMINMIQELNKKTNILIKNYSEYNTSNVLTEEEMVLLLNNSKFSYNFNNKEGNCRLIQESMLCGSIPVINPLMNGGMKEHYYNWNTITFKELIKHLNPNDNFEKLHNSFNIKNIVEYSKNNFNEYYTIKRFKKSINDYFKEEFEYFDLENLAKKLPSHKPQEITKFFFSKKTLSYEFFNSELIIRILRIII